MAPLRIRKRGQDGCGGGGCDDDEGGAVAILGALGLGGFAGLDLRAAPDESELELTAAYDEASGCISVSACGVSVSVSPADLAAALKLPLGPAVPAELDASVLRSEEAIAVVRVFLRDRVLLGVEDDARGFPDEVAVALQLVDDGMAQAVDWCGLFWELLKMDLVTGKSRRYAPHLLHLMTCQRPELFAEVDGSSPLGKRRKGMLIQQCQWTADNSDLVVSKEVKVEKAILVRRKSRDAHNQEVEGEVEAGLASGVDQSTGDLEEMAVFGEGKEVNAVDPFYYRSSIMEAGRWIHGMRERNAGLGSEKKLPAGMEVLGYDMECDEEKDSSGMNAKDQSSPDDPSFLNLISKMDDQDDSSNFQKVIPGPKPQPGPNQQRIIDIKDDEDDEGNIGVCPIIPVTTIGPSNLMHYVQQRSTQDIQNDQTLSSFFACTHQFKSYLDNIFLEKEKDLQEAKAANELMINMVLEKEDTIASIKRDILEVLEARHTMIRRFEHDMEMMCCTVHQYKKLLENSSTAFLEYKNKISRVEGGGSSVEVPGITDGLNQSARLQMLYIHQRISGIQKHWLTKCSELAGYITKVVQRMTDLSAQLQRQKHPTTIPDLNNGIDEENGSLGKALFSNTMGGAWEGEGDHCSSSVQLDELAQPGQRNCKER